jgi:GST-like protein
MLKFYYNAAPNPMKVSLFLEESGLDYDPVPIDGRAGDQHKPEFLAVNPNAKVPVIIDDGITVFDSNAILLYLAQKTGKFLPEDTSEARAQLLSWLMFVATGVGPYSGQSVHFKNFAPENQSYAINRYDFEAERHYGILDGRLAEVPYMLGETYTIVDMAVWGWARMIPIVRGENTWRDMPNLSRLVNEINARPAAERANALKDRHTFRTDMDDEARGYMFPQNTRLVG